MKVRLGQFGQFVNVGSPIVGGGEGSICPNDFSDSLLFKLFHRPSLQKEKKILAMLDHPPKIACRVHRALRVTWPLEILYDPKGNFVGYAMARVPNAIKLFDIYHRSRVSTAKDRDIVLNLAYDICEIIDSLHQDGIMIGDINESNILVAQKHVTFIDTDSFQIRGNGEIYRCEVGRPEFMARETIGRPRRDFNVLPEHDNHALNVLLFLLFMNGVHPYHAGWTGKGPKPSLAERIQKGMWPYGRRGKAMQVRPPRSAPSFTDLPAGFCDLFSRCFEMGHFRPTKRPQASDWMKEIALVKSRNLQGIATGSKSTLNVWPHSKASTPNPLRRLVHALMTPVLVPLKLTLSVLLNLGTKLQRQLGER